jgi:hypothetical protein
MAHRRSIAPVQPMGEHELTSALVGIGFQLAAPAPAKEPNIEDVIFAASEEGMERDDLRVLALLATWLGVHAPRVNADRLTRLVFASASPRVQAFWSAVGQWRKSDPRFRRLASLHAGERVHLLRVGGDFQVARRGEDPRFVGTALIVPAGVLRDRSEDVLSPAKLSRRHAGYRCRVLMGPTYRADMWAALQLDPDLTPAELARRTYGSFATAWSVKRDHSLLRGVVG